MAQNARSTSWFVPTFGQVDEPLVQVLHDLPAAVLPHEDRPAVTETPDQGEQEAGIAGEERCIQVGTRLGQRGLFAFAGDVGVTVSGDNEVGGVGAAVP